MKGVMDISLLIAFNPETIDSIAAKPYAGNMLDQTYINDFVSVNNIKSGMMIFNMGFYNEKIFEDVDKIGAYTIEAELCVHKELRYESSYRTLYRI